LCPFAARTGQLTVAAVALALLHLRFGMLPSICGEAVSNVSRFLEFTLFVTADEALVGSGVDEFTRHDILLTKRIYEPSIRFQQLDSAKAASA
jgi:hypothetical protein